MNKEELRNILGDRSRKHSERHTEVEITAKGIKSIKQYCKAKDFKKRAVNPFPKVKMEGRIKPLNKSEELIRMKAQELSEKGLILCQKCFLNEVTPNERICKKCSKKI